MILCCEICQQPIATFDQDKLDDPIRADMFQSVDAKRGIPAPFTDTLEWGLWVCPICGFHPFEVPDSGQSHPDKLFIGVSDKGERQYVPIKQEGKKYQCDICGFETDYAGAMNGHMVKHKPKKDNKSGM